MSSFRRRKNPFAYRSSALWRQVQQLGLADLLEDIIAAGPVPTAMAQAQWTAKISLTQAVRRDFLLRTRVDGIDVVTLGSRGRMAVGLDRSYTPSQGGLQRGLLRRAVAEYARTHGGRPMPLDHEDYPYRERLFPVIGGVGTEPNAWVLIGRRPYPPREVSRERALSGGDAFRHHATIVAVTRSPAETAEICRRERHNILTWPIDDLRAGVPTILQPAVR